MRYSFTPSAATAVTLAVLLVGPAAEGQQRGTATAQRGSSAEKTSTVEKPSAILTAQVALDRAGFSPGAIDGQLGKNTEHALRAFQQSRGLTVSGTLDRPTLEALNAGAADALTTYTITEDDVRGPFVEDMPVDMLQKAELAALLYTSVTEDLAERFHTTEDLLRQLNPAASFAAGDQIRVPAVDGFNPADVAAGLQKASGKAGRGTEPGATGTSGAAPSEVRIVVARDTGALQVIDASGQVVFHAPVTMGSEQDPLPVGTWKVTGVSYNPTYNYNPDLFWDADPADAKATIKPGPNNPVGVVWIDLSKEHYGIHGTPEPERIGYSASHGCVRLTNWDAIRVAQRVAAGTTVIFK